MVAMEVPAQCKGKALLRPCLQLAGWAEAGGEGAQCWGRMGPWIRSGLWQFSAPAVPRLSPVTSHVCLL